jgi:hypothetical protein
VFRGVGVSRRRLRMDNDEDQLTGRPGHDR